MVGMRRKMLVGGKVTGDHEYWERSLSFTKVNTTISVNIFPVQTLDQTQEVAEYMFIL